MLVCEWLMCIALKHAGFWVLAGPLDPIEHPTCTCSCMALAVLSVCCRSLRQLFWQSVFAVWQNHYRVGLLSWGRGKISCYVKWRAMLSTEALRLCCDSKMCKSISYNELQCLRRCFTRC